MMHINLAAGTLLIAATVVIHTVGLITLSRLVNFFGSHFGLSRATLGRSAAMITVVLGLFLVHTVEVWTWALAYLAIGAIDNMADALYFSTVTFSTVGYGDVVLASEWRLFSSLEGINGFMLIGWSTAFLVAASTRHGPFNAGEHF
ncbi:potassium channel family protein [Rhodoligotrophos ferricapiens]|uniref:potassium channel family protein n=1 Tax=Rhodoligotrophos ferricapiens TaxID=3069264 RepID=UPI00315CC37D